MGWEMRGSNGPYYTRSTRVNGRVVREYVGRGPGADLAARRDAERRAERRAETERWEAERARVEAADEAVVGWCNLAQALLGSALDAAGYHRHDRGQWRRRRGQKQAPD
jgi:hypothetical protein